jgi:hypothetical protein
METIKVRVTKAKPYNWYRDAIGTVFEVKKLGSSCYELVTDRTMAIYKDDCEIVEPSLNDRFEPLTSGGYPFHIYEEFEGRLFGRVNVKGKWWSKSWYIDGSNNDISIYDIIPLKSPETIALEKRKAELQAELTEIENNLNK